MVDMKVDKKAAKMDIYWVVPTAETTVALLEQKMAVQLVARTVVMTAVMLVVQKVGN